MNACQALDPGSCHLFATGVRAWLCTLEFDTYGEQPAAPTSHFLPNYLCGVCGYPAQLEDIGTQCPWGVLGTLPQPILYPTWLLEPC